ncbi:MAG: DNA recombination protein RmuC [bacterium]|nr:DNA recombination protein RmuC [bacterium]
MNELLFAILGFILGGFLIYFLRKPQKDSGELLLIQNQMQELSRKLEDGLGKSTDVLQRQFGESAKIIREVTERLTKLDETNRQVVNFADQLKNLQDILQNPKQRGVLGEYFLETVLKNVLPPGSYEMQYQFKDGTAVDAVVRVKDKIIPIDSKFSLENYNRLVETRDPAERERLERQFRQDLKNRIDETSKYVKPSEGTLDFAFMFIPSEAVYYDLLINKVGAVKINTQDLVEYAFKERHVIIVSPTSFLAYLQTVLQGLKALQIEESAKEMRKFVENLSRHLISYEDYLKKLGKNLGTTVGMYDKAYGEFTKIDKDIYRITGEGIEAEPLAIAKPREEE